MLDCTTSPSPTFTTTTDPASASSAVTPRARPQRHDKRRRADTFCYSQRHRNMAKVALAAAAMVVAAGLVPAMAMWPSTSYYIDFVVSGISAPPKSAMDSLGLSSFATITKIRVKFIGDRRIMALKGFLSFASYQDPGWIHR